MPRILTSLVFGVAIFSSASLIFLVQPMVGKRILPWFGGAPAVWSLCLAFYQTVLFAGYAYAHALIRFATPRSQLIIHACLLGGAMLLLPVVPGAGIGQGLGTRPEVEILWLLGAHVALPFLALSATGPLVQAWFYRAEPDRSPYFLYAVSNVGSLLGLFGYSFFLESAFPLSITSGYWSLGFIATAIAILACAAFALHGSPPSDSSARVNRNSETNPAPSDADDSSQPLLWLGLSASAVILMMGVTNELCMDIASVPFLWVLLLAAYLASFIVAFSAERFHFRWLHLGIAASCIIALYGLPTLQWKAIAPETRFMPVGRQILFFTGLVFSGCMVLHAELYRLRPAASALTRFYLFVSAGGALGGLFVGIVAPTILDGFYEVVIAMVLSWICLVAAWRSGTSGWLAKGRARLRMGVIIAVTSIVVAPIASRLFVHEGSTLQQERGFFGILRVMERPSDQGFRERMLVSGATIHGLQLVGWPFRKRPTSYYGRQTAIGIVLDRPAEDKPLDVGVVGLGVGTLAAYGREGDHFRFYEIDPMVSRIAADTEYFHFLSDSEARVEIVNGDGRLALAEEASGNSGPRFDLLVIDAFSSDAIPVHLLTTEAFGVYLARLKPHGLLAVHHSNNFFDLGPVIARSGRENDLTALTIANAELSDHDSRSSLWTLLALDRQDLVRLEERAMASGERLGGTGRPVATHWYEEDELAGSRPWTDDFSDLLGALY
jgi:hypothetical protein